MTSDSSSSSSAVSIHKGEAASVGSKSKSEVYVPPTFTEKAVYILLTVSSAAGFGNVWRFPKLVEANGGAAFIIIYLIGAVLFAWPAVVLEVVIGQMSRGNLWDAGLAAGNKKFVFVGNQIIGIFMMSGYYACLIAWAILYLVQSGSQPWFVDNDEEYKAWCESTYEGGESCHSTVIIPGHEYIDENGNPFEDPRSLPERAFCMWSKEEEKCVPDSLLWGKYFFDQKLIRQPINLSISEDNVGYSSMISEMNWPLFGAYLFVVITVYLSLGFGKKVLSIVMYVAGVLPALLLLGLLFYSVTLEGASDGIKEYIGKIDSSVLYDVDAWRSAIGQVIFSASIGSYVMTGFSGQNNLDGVIGTNSIIIIIADTVFAIIAGFIMYALMGVVALKQGISVSDAAGSGGAGMLFVVFSYGVSTLSDNKSVTAVIHVLWWVVILLLGWCTWLGYVENMTNTLVDSIIVQKLWPEWSRRKKKIVILSIVSGCYFVMCWCNVSDMSKSVVDVIDRSAGSYILPFNAAINAYLFGHLMGLSKYQKKVGKLSSYLILGVLSVCGLIAGIARYMTDEKETSSIIYFVFAIFVPILCVPFIAFTVEDNEYNKTYSDKIKNVWNGEFKNLLDRSNEIISHHNNHCGNGMMPARFLDGLIRWILAPFFGAMIIDTFFDYETWISTPEVQTYGQQTDQAYIAGLVFAMVNEDKIFNIDITVMTLYDMDGETKIVMPHTNSGKYPDHAHPPLPADWPIDHKITVKAATLNMDPAEYIIWAMDKSAEFEKPNEIPNFDTEGFDSAKLDYLGLSVDDFHSFDCKDENKMTFDGFDEFEKFFDSNANLITSVNPFLWNAGLAEGNEEFVICLLDPHYPWVLNIFAIICVAGYFIMASVLIFLPNLGILFSKPGTKEGIFLSDSYALGYYKKEGYTKEVVPIDEMSSSSSVSADPIQ